jgi:hypothetical protein
MRKIRDQMTACFIHFRCWTPHVVRYIGGQHTGAHRNLTALQQQLEGAGVDKEVVSDLLRSLRYGAPRAFKAEFTDANFRAALKYGNHASIDETKELQQHTKKCFEKDIRKGFALAMDPLLAFFVPNLHITPIGLILAPNKNPRIFFDSSFRPQYWSMAINDATNLQQEPAIHFAGAFTEQLSWIWNLRISYRHIEIYLGDDDVSGAFRQMKYNCNVVSLHTCIIYGLMFMYTGQTFGDSPSPPNWEPIVTARKALARKLWADEATISRGQQILPSITRGEPPTKGESATFAQPTADSSNQGVFDTNGQRLPPPYPHHVDDCYYADVDEHLYKTVVASLIALYTILGRPSAWNTDVVSWEKFTNQFTHQRKINGWIVNSRSLTLTLPEDKRRNLVDLLSVWTTKTTFTLRELAVLLGLLTDHSRPIPWLRARYAALFYEFRAVLQHRYHTTTGVEFRRKLATRVQVQLPAEIRYRLAGIVATEVAQKLWQSTVPIKISAPAIRELHKLQRYAVNHEFRWEGSIGHMIQRDPDFESYGDASLTAGSGYNLKLRFYFLLFWRPALCQHFTRTPQDDQFRHINDMEFIVIIVQLAGILTWMEVNQWHGVAPTTLFWSDNTSSAAWAAAAYARSPRLRGLVELYSELLERGRIKPRSAYLTSDANHQADFISRLVSTDSPPSHHQQISLRYNGMTSFQIFRPSFELLRLIEARTYSDALAVHPRPPSNLGQFVDVESVSSNSWLG